MNPLTMFDPYASEQPAHSDTGASSMDRWSECPGSVRESRGKPRYSSKYAEGGQVAHDLAATWLRSGVEPKFPDREMRDAVATYVEICNNYFTPEHQRWGAIRGIEHRFDLSAAVMPGCFGTSDYWVFWPWLGLLIVLDFKYGAGIFVDVVNNLQVQYYALGVLRTLHLPVTRIEIGIVQPRCMADGQPHRTWTIDSMDLFDFEVQLIDAVTRTQDPHAPLIPGDHCRFCPAASQCPELATQANAVAQYEFSAARAYDPQQLAKALDSLDFVRAYVKAVDEFAYRELEAGRDIPGYKLVEKKPTRKWLDEELTLSTLRAAGFSDRQIYAPSDVRSPAQMEKTIPKSHHDMLAGLVSKSPSGHAVVPVSDPRPAIRCSPESEFSAIVVNPFDGC